MANARGKQIDTTHLSLDHAEERGFVHRDYLAHCLRWSHVVKHLTAGHRYKTDHVLDVGCGREVPLARLMYSSRFTHTTGSYTGVDVGPIPWPESISKTSAKFRPRFLEKTDAADPAKIPAGKHQTIVCFEVLEHVEASHSLRLLQAIRRALAPDGTAFVSTPVYDPRMGAAANHVNEMSYELLDTLIGGAGLETVKTYGTFASQKDYKKILAPHHRKVFDELSAYYDSNVLACLLAPLYPRQARNCLWQLRHASTPSHASSALRRLKMLTGPEHSSSARWPEEHATITAALRGKNGA